ncbi:AraC family transcriptional regulator [Aquibacillus sediminis]|uniref:AraC family transcriptional regulator n=1 Tax=Aquibacillus sediminis TaxID=2574734 RepID=UPI001108D544|nr:AraC family transcriptional regulator [Aquibacillus sediminis]
MHYSNRDKLHSQFIKLQLKNRQNEYLHPSFLMETRLQDAIKNADLLKALKILESINKDQRPQLSTTTIRSLKNSLICSCTLFTRSIIAGGVHPEKAFTLSDVYILEIERCDSAPSLNELEYEMLRHFIDVLSEEEESPYSTTINNAISFINEHILSDITLQQIADHCFVNPSYLSHLFKKEVGISVVKYINKKRVEEAKYVLLHTTDSIADIAMLFRFCNSSYFTSQFKLYQGMTPRQFRDRHLS